jgi:uncharacterized protein YjcR
MDSFHLPNTIKDWKEYYNWLQQDRHQREAETFPYLAAIVEDLRQ